MSVAFVPMIHPTAVIHPGAQLDSSVRVGPYAVIDEAVRIGAQCSVGAHVHLTGHTVIGTHNHFHTGCVIGDAPQDLKYKDASTRLRIGDHNVFREHFTVNRSNKLEEDTVIGSHNFLMAHSHIGHNSVLGDYIIMANGALLAGHVTVQDRAFISGNCMVHQFVRVGTLSLMQGGSAISKDLPPFCVARGPNRICGLNVIGLRRAGFSAGERLALKKLYHLLFRSGNRLSVSLRLAKEQFTGPAIQTVLDFLGGSHRGVCAHKGGLRVDSQAEE